MSRQFTWEHLAMCSTVIGMVVIAIGGLTGSETSMVAGSLITIIGAVVILFRHGP